MSFMVSQICTVYGVSKLTRLFAEQFVRAKRKSKLGTNDPLVKGHTGDRASHTDLMMNSLQWRHNERDGATLDFVTEIPRTKSQWRG